MTMMILPLIQKCVTAMNVTHLDMKDLEVMSVTKSQFAMIAI
jgi:hypothetical protein